MSSFSEYFRDLALPLLSDEEEEPDPMDPRRVERKPTLSVEEPAGEIEVELIVLPIVSGAVGADVGSGFEI